MMAAKMDKKLIALCSAAIGIVYAAGLTVTQPAAAAQQDGVVPAAAVAPAPAQAAAPVQVATSKYKDGTYVGRGSNRIGSVEVAVSIKNDKITDVQITNCTTHYSQSRIDALPGQVLARQSSDVDIVSGATKSTQDFQTAVQAALAQAETQARALN